MFHERTQELLDQHVESTDEPAARQLTVVEALDIAQQLHQQDRVAEADVVYREILCVEPENAAALHFGGIAAHQLGRSAEGIETIRRSLALAPHSADWHNNLGIVLQESGDFDGAVAMYRRAIELNGSHANAHSNLGVLLRATGKPAEAEASYRKAIELNPEHIDAWTNLGILLNAQKRSKESVECFCRVITLRPRHPEARRLLALAHCALGEVDEAIRIFNEWLEEEPDDPVARHMLSACTGNGIPERASDGYVAHTFDSFAASFESKLARLSYRAPALVGAVLDDAGLERAKSFDVLDAGCGTGLCGPLVAPYARRLVGVDLSTGMLTQAAAKKIYDELLHGELTAYLHGQHQSLDIIVSADTLVYFGPLDDVIGAAAGALRPGGLLIFTLEHGAAPDAPDFHLETHGRYTHSRSYVERLLAANDFEMDIGTADLRMESGAAVAGLVVRARKARR
ncbi:MAG TPA: tetratricopeptide repeat protein [Vicinamibacterales bacterium]|jgi:predicted TPR repeat methyltransferase|nr:tetratricopeptide repeat protein [Vicinamibacterales bacterium]